MFTKLLERHGNYPLVELTKHPTFLPYIVELYKGSTKGNGNPLTKDLDALNLRVSPLPKRYKTIIFGRDYQRPAILREHRTQRGILALVSK